jgi:hypothetical protein
MSLKYLEFEKINYWCIYTIEVETEVYDIVIINYTDKKLDLKYKFKRHKAFCFYELFLDYGETYIPDVEFIELRNQLRNVYYLELSKDIEELHLYDDSRI